MDTSLTTPALASSFTVSRNGKAERMIHTTNDVMRSLLLQGSLPTRYWVENLHAATYLNLLPTKAILTPSLHFALFGTTPSYTHLRVFGCACYPNTSATANHKLPPPHSCQCIFLGYSSEHKGYRCLDLATNRLLVSRIIFDKSSFPFASSDTPHDDLDSLFLSSTVVSLIAPPYPSFVAGTSETVVAPRTEPASPPVS
jgi:hypothetical protein